MTFIIEIEKSTLKLIWKHKRPKIAKAILNKKSNAGGITISNSKLQSNHIITTWYWHKKQIWRQVGHSRRPRQEST
jgi:hypothetical protein